MTRGKKQSSNEAASPEIANKKVESPATTTILESKSWSISEQVFMKLVKSVELISAKIDEIQEDVKCMKSKQEAIFVSLISLDKKVENLEKIAERESPVCEEMSNDVKKIKKKTFDRDQEKLNDRLIMKNLPYEIIDDKAMMKSIIKNVFATLEININETQFNAFATKTNDKKAANIVVKLSSEILKSEIVRKYRKVKKEGNSLLVKKLANIPDSHPLSGKMVQIANKLSRYNTILIQNARDNVPSHFDFVYDTPESLIMVNINNKFYQIENNDDIDTLVDEVDRIRKKKEDNEKAFKEIASLFDRMEERRTQSKLNL